MWIHKPVLCLLLWGIFFSCSDVDNGRQAATTLPEVEGMVRIDHPDGGYWMDATETTTAQFARFIEASGYRTEADSFGWSGVFSLETLTWVPVNGANWQYPLGPDAPAAAPNDPVTQVSLRDALAYAEWAGKRLPTEQEWMYAANQGDGDQEYPWGKEMLPEGEYLGNWWQGPFPYRNEVRDGFAGVAPVQSYPPSGNGLYDISGNVWEWTTSQSPHSQERIIKGGSFLCSTSYCTGFNLRQRQFTPPDSGLNHLGFRCVKG
ncbi:sulfatase modifying factor 1 [Neolewinella xylanilytica]|uniref:Sulfatase modifying factor 1 n=1 Tax=Neolewinella xylanilytica TaxID=1514080 RepID=A0A2S6I696_9BACT|nr:SUMF1/EgtB/PvdO family nonheme iron enzyme [Neolewinella xylanilytica]PPK86698.1 sulfatase modifying factor 1 [Neolewinella xylanilytica]